MALWAVRLRPRCAALMDYMADDITIRGQATLEWGDQIRFLARRLTIVLLKIALVMAPVFGVIWALDLSNQEWLALRTRPLASLGHFLADAWLAYFVTFALLALVVISQSFFAFLRFPPVHRQLTYEVNATGILTRDAADFALMVPWASIVHTRDTPRILYMQTATRAWRYLLWRAFPPTERDQILRWATRKRANEPMSPG
jgi:hypothetical protein